MSRSLSSTFPASVWYWSTTSIRASGSNSSITHGDKNVRNDSSFFDRIGSDWRHPRNWWADDARDHRRAQHDWRSDTHGAGRAYADRDHDQRGAPLVGLR